MISIVWWLISFVRSTHSDVLCIKDFQKLFPKFKRNTCDMPILSAVLNLALQLDLKKTLWQLLVDSLEKLWITIPKLFQLLKWSSFIISWLDLLCYLILIVTLWQTNLYLFSLLLTTWGYSISFLIYVISISAYRDEKIIQAGQYSQ